MFNIRFVHYIVTALYCDSIILIDNASSEKVVSKQPFASLSKSHFTAILRVLCQNGIDLVISNEL